METLPREPRVPPPPPSAPGGPGAAFIAAEDTIRRLRRRLWMERCGFTLALVAVAGAWLSPTLFPRVWAVYVDGKPILALKDRKTLDGLLEQARAEAGDESAAFTQQVQVARAHPRDVEVTDAQTARERLAEVLQLRAERAVIYVDGVAAVALPDEASASEVLDRVKAAFAGDTGQLERAPTFKEAIEVRVEGAGQDLWAEPDTAVALLKGEGGEPTRRHTVRRGETLSEIAARHASSVETLRQLNPGLKPSRLRPGDTLLLGAGSEPVVTVVTETRETRTVPISYATQVRRSPAMYVGKRVLKQPGRPGLQQVTFRVRSENGIPVSRAVLQRKKLQSPRDKIVVLGGKPRPR